MRNMTLTATETLVTETCCNCGVLFAMPDYLREKLLNNHNTFYCPNGHGQSYRGKSEAELQRERAERLASQIKQVGNRLEAERRSHSATFANVARHMASQHPEFEAADA